MAVKKKPAEEVVLTEQDLLENLVLVKAGLKAGDVGTPAPAGTVIKTYVQNGLRYNRITTENGGTVDVRA
jgi:hypothetical protein